MRTGAILSVLLHTTVLLLLLTGLPNLFRREPEQPIVVPIDVINIADITQAQALKVQPKQEKAVKEIKDPKLVPPKSTPVEEKTPEPEEKAEPDLEPEKTPEPEVTMEDLLALVPEDKPKKEEKPKEKPKEKLKEKSKKKKKKKKKPDFTALLNDVEKVQATAEGKAQKEQDIDSTADHAASNIGDILSVTELDLIRRQLAQCWNVPAGARDAKDLYVDIKVEMNPDATVRTAVIVGSSGKGGAFEKAATDSALRAVKNPACSPLKLPLDRYEHWKTITIRFDPQNIL